jgi:hypothetical protein
MSDSCSHITPLQINHAFACVMFAGNPGRTARALGTTCVCRSLRCETINYIRGQQLVTYRSLHIVT